MYSVGHIITLSSEHLVYGLTIYGLGIILKLSLIFNPNKPVRITLISVIYKNDIITIHKNSISLHNFLGCSKVRLQMKFNMQSVYKRLKVSIIAEIPHAREIIAHEIVRNTYETFVTLGNN